MKYLRSTTLGCKDIGIRKSEYVSKTQFLYITVFSGCYESMVKKLSDFVNPALNICSLSLNDETNPAGISSSHHTALVDI